MPSTCCTPLCRMRLESVCQSLRIQMDSASWATLLLGKPGLWSADVVSLLLWLRRKGRHVTQLHIYDLLPPAPGFRGRVTTWTSLRRGSHGRHLHCQDHRWSATNMMWTVSCLGNMQDAEPCDPAAACIVLSGLAADLVPLVAVRIEQDGGALNRQQTSNVRCQHVPWEIVERILGHATFCDRCRLFSVQ